MEDRLGINDNSLDLQSPAKTTSMKAEDTDGLAEDWRRPEAVSNALKVCLWFAFNFLMRFHDYLDFNIKYLIFTLNFKIRIWNFLRYNKDKTLEKGIPRGIIGLNYLSKFVCTHWAVLLMYSSSWILVGWKFYSLTNNYASSVFTNLYYVKFWD